MAKKTTAGVTKAQAIRDYLAKNPDAMPRATADALAKEGVMVTTQDVSVAKHKLKASGGKTPGPVAKPNRPAKGAGSITFADLQQAKAMAQQLGGVDEAKNALEALAELTG